MPAITTQPINPTTTLMVMDAIGENTISSKPGNSANRNRDMNALCVNNPPAPLQMHAIRTTIAAVVTDVLSSDIRLNVEAGLNKVPKMFSNKSAIYFISFFLLYFFW
jgi:hypothetical protein